MFTKCLSSPSSVVLNSVLADSDWRFDNLCDTVTGFQSNHPLKVAIKFHGYYIMPKVATLRK